MEGGMMGLSPLNMSSLFSWRSFPSSMPDEVYPFWLNFIND